jgi:hypothetical protein
MRVVVRVAVGALALGVGGCTSILGDFTPTGGPDATTGDVAAPPVTEGAAPEPDVSSPIDASSSDATASEAGPVDAGAKDAGAGTGTLSCSSWRWVLPITVEDLAAAPVKTFSGRMAVFPGNSDQVRIVAAKAGSPPYSIYTVTKATENVQQQDAVVPDGGIVPSVDVIHHVSSDTGGTTAIVMSQRSGAAAGATTSYTVTALSDLVAPNNPLPAPFTLLSSVNSSQTVADVAVSPFATNDIFEAVAIGSGNPAVYTLGVARVTPTASVTPAMLAPIATSANQGDFTGLRLLHANSSVYVYSMNDVSTPGCSGWTVPDTAIVASPPPAKQVIASGASVGVVGTSQNGSLPAADVFMLEEDFSAQLVSGYKYYVGTVAFPSLSSWMSTSLTDLHRSTSPFAAPVFNASPVNNLVPWFDDNAMMLGPGLRNGVTDAGVGPGLNLLWVTASGGIRADQTGATSILNDRSNFVAAMATPAKITATSATWDVVWIESVTGLLGATHHVMRMNELECQ